MYKFRFVALLSEVMQLIITKMFLNEILGAIDGTHVLIKTPSGHDGCQYINRKGRASINVSVSIWLFKIRGAF